MSFLLPYKLLPVFSFSRHQCPQTVSSTSWVYRKYAAFLNTRALPKNTPFAPIWNCNKSQACKSWLAEVYPLSAPGGQVWMPTCACKHLHNASLGKNKTTRAFAQAKTCSINKYMRKIPPHKLSLVLYNITDNELKPWDRVLSSTVVCSLKGHQHNFHFLHIHVQVF